MADEPEGQSVHIELDADAAQANPSDPQPGGKRTARLTVTIGLGAIALVALLVFMARSPRSSAPDGDSASSTTTATVRSQETGAGVGSTSTTVAAAPSIFVPTVGISYLLSVLPDEIGYLGLGIDEMSTGAPNILRSVDGVNWVPVNTVLGNSVAPPQDLSRQNRSFEELIRLDDGFAVLLSTSIYDDTTGLESDVRIERLISSDAVMWEVDPSFDPIATDRLMRTFAHGPDSFVYLTDPRENLLLQKLVAEHLIDGETIDACSMWGLDGDRSLVVNLCRSGTQLKLGPTDVVDPLRFDDLGRCAVVVGAIGSATNNFWVATRASPPVPFGPGNFLSPPLVASDGTVVSVDLGSAPWVDRSSCDGFIDVPEPRVAALVVWDPADPSSLDRRAITIDADAFARFPAQVMPTISGQQFLFGSSTAIESVDIDTGEWVELLELSEPVAFAAVLSEGGSSLVQFEGGSVLVTDVQSGEQRSREDETNTRLDVLTIVYADDDIALVWDGSSTFFVELPTQ